LVRHEVYSLTSPVNICFIVIRNQIDINGIDECGVDKVVITKISYKEEI